MLLPEFLEELFYSKKINLFETNFKIYLEKVRDYSFLETQSFLKRLNKNYSIEGIEELKNVKYLNLENNKLKSIPTLNLQSNWVFCENPITSK